MVNIKTSLPHWGGLWLSEAEQGDESIKYYQPSSLIFVHLKTWEPVDLSSHRPI